MTKTKKGLPKRPEDLWAKKEGTQNILAVAKALKAAQDREERLKKRKKRQHITIRREE